MTIKHELMVGFIIWVLVTLAMALALACNGQELRRHDEALTNLLAAVAAEQAKGTRPVMLPWTDAEAPTNATPRPLPRSWDFATNQVQALPLRFTVWTFEGPAGSTWCLLAEARVAGDRSNVVRRALFPGLPVTSDLPTEWPEEPKGKAGIR